MATTTRDNTTYETTLLRLHALEEYVAAEIAALKAVVEDLEPGDPEDTSNQDRIYDLTVKGAQSDGIDDVPQGPSIYDDFSIHQSLWGQHPDMMGLLAGIDWSGGTGPVLKPLAEKIASPWHTGTLAETFWTSNKSVISVTFGAGSTGEGMYDAVVEAGSICELSFGSPSRAADMVADGKSLHEMITDLDLRLTLVEAAI